MAYTYRELKGLSDKGSKTAARTTNASARLVMLTWVIAGLTLANTALVAFAPGE
jgi:hypothetical protein